MELGYYDIILGCRMERQVEQMAFYDLFAPSLYASAFRLLADSWEAEEVVQEVLLRVLTNKELLIDYPEDMQRVLRRMVINLCIDRLRERRIQWEEWDERFSIASEDNAEVDIIKQENLVQLHTAIASMSEKDRTVLMLSIVEELSTEEISQILRIKPSSVRSQFCRAKQKLVKLYRNK